jgi:tripeptide aminopeptidase
MRPASEAERAVLNALFAELCAIPSPSGHEAACAERVAGELRAMGLTPEGDEHGNLLARVPGRGDRTVLLCAHLDTVPHDRPIEPVLVDDGWENANEAILGADNKAAVAVMLAAARRAAVESAPVGLELLFTVREETALEGAKAFDVSRLQSAFGYVFDLATPIGEVVMASPTYFRLEAEFVGRSAHAGIRPEEGRNAIVAAARAVAALTLGRLDDETTANVGTIRGGSGWTNVVPDRCTVLGEVRSIDPRRAEAVVADVVDRIHDAANDPADPVDVDVDVARLFSGYRQDPAAPVVAAAEAALRATGHTPVPVVSGGASDANALIPAGLPVACLANGTERNHEPTERVSVAALEGMFDVTLALLEESAHA